MSSKTVDIIRELKGLKAGNLKSFQIPVKNQSGITIGWLKPINEILSKDIFIVDSLTKWRRKFIRHFLTQFEPTNERTISWLESVVLPDDTRILFLILDTQGKLIGNFGICDINQNSAELDNLIRGEKGGDSQLIFFSEISLMHWIYKNIKVADIYLRVFSNNFRTKALHELVGFEECQSQYLIKTCNNNGEVEYQSSDIGNNESEQLKLIKMRMKRNIFMEKYSNIN